MRESPAERVTLHVDAIPSPAARMSRRRVAGCPTPSPLLPRPCLAARGDRRRGGPRRPRREPDPRARDACADARPNRARRRPRRAASSPSDDRARVDTRDPAQGAGGHQVGRPVAAPTTSIATSTTTPRAKPGPSAVRPASRPAISASASLLARPATPRSAARRRTTRTAPCCWRPARRATSVLGELYGEFLLTDGTHLNAGRACASIRPTSTATTAA